MANESKTPYPVDLQVEYSEPIFRWGALLGVLFLTFVIGVGCAYVVSFYKFPGVNFFKWALMSTLSPLLPPVAQPRLEY